MIIKNRLRKYILFIAYVFLFCMTLEAAAPRITSVTFNPPNPSFGDAVAITVTMCGNLSVSNDIVIAISTSATRLPPGSGGQVFVVDANGIDVRDVNVPNMMSYVHAPAGGTTDGCTNCGGDPSKSVTRTYNVRVPTADYYSSCNPASMYIHVGAKDNGLYQGDWVGLSACQAVTQSFAILPPARSFHVTKRYEGILQAAGDKVLFAIDYDYANGAGFNIVDSVPAGFTLLSYGPTTIPGGTVNNAAGTITWSFPSRVGSPGRAEGTVWMLCQVTGAPIGDYTNTATGNMTGETTQNTSVTVTTGQAAITLVKDQSATTVNYMDNITYTLSYVVNGMVLRNFQSFDNAATGTYTPPGSVPTGWKGLPESGVYGTWTVSDPCNTGGHVLTGAATAYPGLLLEDGSGANNSDQFCNGQIVADVFIDPGTFPGADAQIIIRNNSVTAPATDGRSIGIVLSIDNQPAPGYFMYQKCGGAPSWCGNGGGPAGTGGQPGIGAISANKWYRVRIQVTTIASGQRIEAKVWARGDAEPANYDITYDDLNLDSADWLCDGTGTYTDWRPGVNEQKGDTNDVRDSYDNFTTYELRVQDSAFVDDDVPAGLTYQGCLGGCSGGPAGPIRWNIPGPVYNASGSFTWWARATGCGQISNRAIIGSPGNANVYSNWVNANIICPEITGITKTANVAVASLGQVFTWSISYCNTGPSALTNYLIWDTRPTTMSYGGCSGGTSCGQAGGMITWSFASLPNVAPGACPQGSVTWWGTVVGPFPMNPFILPGEIYATVEDAENYIKSYLWQ